MWPIGVWADWYVDGPDVGREGSRSRAGNRKSKPGIVAIKTR